MQAPKVYVSWGELIDKITILEIKMSEIDRAAALANIGRELAALRAETARLPANDSALDAMKNRLAEVNKALWDVEDALRQKEARAEFDADFIALARSVYKTNDLRARIKRDINDHLASEFYEEKSYKS